MFAPRLFFTRLSGLPFHMGGPIADMASHAVSSMSVVERCEDFLHANGGASTVRQLTMHCIASNEPVTLTELARLIKTGAIDSHANDGNVQAR